jgi:hypothetical protein
MIRDLLPSDMSLSIVPCSLNSLMAVGFGSTPKSKFEEIAVIGSERRE